MGSQNLAKKQIPAVEGVLPGLLLSHVLLPANARNVARSLSQRAPSAGIRSVEQSRCRKKLC
jgi:hypothetical protein